MEFRVCFAMAMYENDMFLLCETLMDTETDRDGPERTETDRNGPKRTFVGTETDFSGYRNGPIGYKIVIRGA